MRKNEMVALISEKTGFARTDILIIVNEMLDIMRDALVIHKDKITFNDFGVFKVEKSNPRHGFDFQQHKRIEIPGYYKVKFTPAKSVEMDLKNEVNDDEEAEI